jgi:hypothetical protein
MSPIMEGTYKISAVPLRYSRGTFDGKLQGVNFTAVSPDDTKHWFANNCGHFELAFSRIMPSSLAKVMVTALMHGDEVEFPGLYEEEQFDRGFMFEWSPVHFVRPPEFVQDGCY